LSLNNKLFSQSVEQNENNFQLLQNSITNPKQSSFDLSGYEGRAMQKIDELAGYIEIISNKDYDPTFREHALTLAKKLFYDKEIQISNSDKYLSNLNILALDDYLNAVLKTSYTKIIVELSNRQYIENLSQDKSESYSGKLLFDQTNYYYKNKEIQNKSTEKKEVEIILVKTDKSFGKKTKSVWNVFLGDIKVVENPIGNQKKETQLKLKEK
jgi:hypothetical protein